RNFLVVVIIGIFLAMLSWLLYACYHYIFHFDTNGQVGNDMLYSFFGIGFIEELVKLIPFLIILHFTNIIRKPIDYLLIASAAGLGFAFFENLLYISQYGLDVIHARALTASVSHMASSAIAAYGFVLVKYRYPKKWWIIPLFFVAAAGAHGFYDFWLLNEKVRSFSIFTLFFFLSEILVYVSFINNALNHSAPENYKQSDIVLNTQRLASFIGGSLVLVFALEYVANCFVYGTQIGNSTLMGSFLSGGYLVFFLAVRLSNIDIIPGEWGRIEFFEGLLPSELMSSRKRAGYNSVVGKKFILRSDVSTGNFAQQLPLAGTMTKRLTIQEDSGWFEFQPEVPVMIGIVQHEFLYIRTKESGETIAQEEPVVIGIFARVQDTFDPQKSKLTFVDWALVG
ncbi:MAG TPA: PrsW family glutamic-type intramembrane protease, partial [Bacteroidia bacterium]|nr:PrsW family glutamic-type intramembrane protease [Bacteroidia bacterium]